jgi:hypothetical protein
MTTPVHVNEPENRFHGRDVVRVDMRVIRVGDVRVEVMTDPYAAGGAASLIFYSDGWMYRMRPAPPNWAEMPEEELSALLRPPPPRRLGDPS